MISLNDAAKLFNLTPTRLRQIINKEKLLIIKGDGDKGKGKVEIPSLTMARLNELRGFKITPKIATVGIEKGGVGKTTTTAHLAVGAARRGSKVLCLDFDPECCLTQFFLKGDAPDSILTIKDVIEKKGQIIDYTMPTKFDGIDILPADVWIRRVERMIMDKNPATLLKSRMIGLKEKYDLVLIDVPPSWNKLTESAYISCDIVIMPVNSDVFSIDSLHLTIEDIEEACEEFQIEAIPEIRIIKNKYGGEKRINARALDDELIKFGSKVIPHSIKNSSVIENCINSSVTVYDKSTKVYTPFIDSYNDILDEIHPRLEVKG